MCLVEIHTRHRRNLRHTNKVSNASEIISRSDIKKELQLALNSLACTVQCP